MGHPPAMAELPPLPDSTVDELNALIQGFDETLGLRFVRISYDEIVGELDVGPALLQPYGLVHGGVYSAMVESLASVGAALNLRPLGMHTVGLDNHTSFLRAVRSGTLCGRARPLARGRRTQVWEVDVTQEGQLVASGRVRTLGVEPGAAMAGEVIALPNAGSAGPGSHS
jgi:1,4-dihydroxy-2-naphthoyl-CoA hydrolase